MKPSIEEQMVTLGECPPGLFRFGKTIGFKSEYRTASESRPGFWQSDAYVVESGEYFWGGTANPIEREQLLVVPLDLATLSQHKRAMAALRTVEKILVEDTNALDDPCCGWGPTLAMVRAALNTTETKDQSQQP